MNGDIGGAAGSRCFRSRKLTTLARAKPVHALVRSWLSTGSLSWGAISGGGGAWSTGMYGRSRKSRRSGTMLRLGLNSIVPPVLLHPCHPEVHAVALAPLVRRPQDAQRPT